MMKRYFKHNILEALRTALIFLSGFLIYEILIAVEKEWNKIEPSHKIHNFYKIRLIKFLLIFLIDLIVLSTLNYFES